MKKNKKLINRRTVVTSGLIAGGTSLLSCKDKNENLVSTKIKKNKNVFNLKMVTTWPKDFPGLGTSANRLASKINKASQGRIKP